MDFDLNSFLHSEYCQVLNLMKAGIYIINKEGDYIYVNEAASRMSGCPIEDGLKLNLFHLDEQGVHVDKSVALEAFKHKKSFTLSNVVSLDSGRTYRQLAFATPLFVAGTNDIDFIIVETVAADILSEEYQIGYNNFYSADFSDIASQDTAIYASTQSRSLFNTAKNIADIDSTVLITGETGTGKQVLVDYIHQKSNRAQAPMISINCASIPESLFESELFGYEKGSFTGALKSGKKGLLESAGNGIVFLDEINSCPLSMQAKLLRVIENRTFNRIGSTKEIPLNCRFIAATNKDLKICVKEGSFREDLYYRLNVITLDMPPLRNRKEDIIPMTHAFFREFSAKYNILKCASPTLFKQLLAYNWPGNVRELRNMIEKLVVLTPREEVFVESIPDIIDFPIQTANYDFSLNAEHHNDYLGFYKEDPEHFSLKTCVESLEASIIKSFMDMTGNTYETAKILKTNQSSISRKIAKYGISYSRNPKKEEN